MLLSYMFDFFTGFCAAGERLCQRLRQPELFFLHSLWNPLCVVQQRRIRHFPAAGYPVCGARYGSQAALPLHARRAGYKPAGFHPRSQTAAFSFRQHRACGHAAHVCPACGTAPDVRALRRHIRAPDCTARFPEGSRSHPPSRTAGRAAGLPRLAGRRKRMLLIAREADRRLPLRAEAFQAFFIGLAQADLPFCRPAKQQGGHGALVWHIARRAPPARPACAQNCLQTAPPAQAALPFRRLSAAAPRSSADVSAIAAAKIQ